MRVQVQCLVAELSLCCTDVTSHVVSERIFRRLSCCGFEMASMDDYQNSKVWFDLCVIVNTSALNYSCGREGLIKEFSWKWDYERKE